MDDNSLPFSDSDKEVFMDADEQLDWLEEVDGVQFPAGNANGQPQAGVEPLANPATVFSHPLAIPQARDLSDDEEGDRNHEDNDTDNFELCVSL